MSASTRPSTVVFDIGGVLLRWDPRNLYQKIFADPAEMEWFLGEVCTSEWNVEQDRGRLWDDAVAILVERHPEWESQIRAYHERGHETIAGVFEENVALLEQLTAAGLPVYAISNFSHEKFVEARERLTFLKLFRGVVVSGEDRMLKPDREIFDLFFSRYALQPQECIFIDDSRANIEMARSLGMHTIHFAEGTDLAEALRGHGVAA